MDRHCGKVAIIIGGASGIGKTAGKLFMEDGAKVFLTGLCEDALKAAANEIGSDDVAWSVNDMHQLQAFKQGRSTWNIKVQVLGQTPRPLS